MRRTRTYSELITLPTFKERFDYLSLGGKVGIQTFGSDRWMNQAFYRSREWKEVRDYVIIRDSLDLPFDLGHPDRPVRGRIVVHHMNPISIDDVVDVTDFLLNPEYLITTSDITHKAIHYGDFNLLPEDYVERRPNDTCPWLE